MDIYTLVNKHSNGKWTRNEDVFSIEHGDIPLVCLEIPEGEIFCTTAALNLGAPFR